MFMSIDGVAAVSVESALSDIEGNGEGLEVRAFRVGRGVGSGVGGTVGGSESVEGAADGESDGGRVSILGD